MPKYLMHGTYSMEGVEGLMHDGGTARHKAIQEAVGSVGGTVESLYFAFGGSDLYFTADLPDQESSIALSLAINAAGGVQVTTVVLITPEEMDRAVKMGVHYHPPGSDPGH